MENNFTLKIKEEIKRKGLKITMQKILILKKLLKMKNHPSAEKLIEEIKKEYSYINISTVYKLLNIFRKKGIVQEIPSFDDERHFDGNPIPHPHIICLKCKKIEDIDEIDMKSIEKIINKIEKKKGYELISKNLIFLGICEKCKERR